MNPTDKAILDALKVNMGRREGEAVAIVLQSWAEHLGGEVEPAFARSRELGRRMRQVYRDARIDAEIFSYVPAEGRHGVDAAPELYNAVGGRAVVFMPTVYSLTHTAFRKALTEQGARVASMPTFTLEMFAEGGPMSVDYAALDRQTRAVAERLAAGRFVRVRGPGTDITVEVDRALVHSSSGLLDRPGSYGNLPGAEAYAVPVHGGETHGYLTVPVGWGGPEPLRHAARLTVEQGRFTGVSGESDEARRYLEEAVRPLVFGGADHEVIAELGIGTNPNVTPEYVARSGWTILTAEKIVGSAHFANGNSRAMGGANDVPVHIDWVVPGVNIEYEYSP